MTRKRGWRVERAAKMAPLNARVMKARIEAEAEAVVTETTVEIVEKAVERLASVLVGSTQGPQGERGEQGSQGAPGETGPQGPPGETGPATVVKAADDENYADLLRRIDKMEKTPRNVYNLLGGGGNVTRKEFDAIATLVMEIAGR